MNDRSPFIVEGKTANVKDVNDLDTLKRIIFPAKGKVSVLVDNNPTSAIEELQIKVQNKIIRQGYKLQTVDPLYEYTQPLDKVSMGERIREERLRLNLTQSTLAESIGISDTYMGAIERGERSLTLKNLVKISNRLGISIDSMLVDSVKDNDSNIVNQFRQITDGQPLKRKQMAINVLRTMFSHLDDENK